MIKKVIVLTAALLFVLLPSGASAESSEELQQQIAELLRQVQTLQEQIAEKGNASLPAPGLGVAITHVLQRGSADAETNGDVTRLQQFLAEDREIYPEGLVTGYYGALTERAVQRWQARKGIVLSGTPATTGYGVVGPRTRRVLLVGVPGTPDDAPFIRNMNPSTALIGDGVRLSGNFAGTNEKVYFGLDTLPLKGTVSGSPSCTSLPCDEFIIFKVPALLNPVCRDVGVAPASVCTHDQIIVQEGETYPVWIENSKGKSNVMMFTVVSGVPGEPGDPVSVGVEMNKTIYTLGEPIEFQVVATNTSDETITLTFGGCAIGYSVNGISLTDDLACTTAISNFIVQPGASKKWPATIDSSNIRYNGYSTLTAEVIGYGFSSPVTFWISGPIDNIGQPHINTAPAN